MATKKYSSLSSRAKANLANIVKDLSRNSDKLCL